MARQPRIHIDGGYYHVMLRGNGGAEILLEVWANVEDKRLTNLASIRLPKIDPTIPFRFLSSGDAMALIGDGSATLDLSYATLRFPDHRDAGNAHAQYLDLHSLSHSPLEMAVPMGMYNVQPSGIEVVGLVGITINMPPINGSYDYLQATGTLVVMLGFDNDAKRIVPIGVGQVAAQQVVSTVALKTLDYIEPLAKHFEFTELSLK